MPRPRRHAGGARFLPARFLPDSCLRFLPAGAWPAPSAQCVVQRALASSAGCLRWTFIPTNRTQASGMNRYWPPASGSSFASRTSLAPSRLVDQRPRYLVTALSEGGLLIFTTHGRYATMVARNAGPTQLHRKLRMPSCPNDLAIRAAPPMEQVSWRLRGFFAFRKLCRTFDVLGLQERGWARHQDVFIVQRVTGWTDPRPAKDNRTGS